MNKIEKIATLLTLHERPHLGAQHFVDVLGARRYTNGLAVVVQRIQLDAHQWISDAFSLRLISTLMDSSRRNPSGTNRRARNPGRAQYITYRESAFDPLLTVTSVRSRAIEIDDKPPQGAWNDGLGLYSLFTLVSR
jgi:hypothetical protein